MRTSSTRERQGRRKVVLVRSASECTKAAETVEEGRILAGEDCEGRSAFLLPQSLGEQRRHSLPSGVLCAADQTVDVQVGIEFELAAAVSVNHLRRCWAARVNSRW